MKVAVTATQGGLTRKQVLGAYAFLKAHGHEIEVFHHGGCIGGDFELQQAAKDVTDARIIMHRGDTPGKWAECEADEVRPSKGNIERNHDMVDEVSDVKDVGCLLACPGERVEVLRSGTWATIRYGTKKAGVKVYIIYPDGTVEIRY